MTQRILFAFSIVLLMTTVAFSQEIVSVNPSSTQQHSRLSVAITGQNTHFTSASGFAQGSPVFSQGSPIWFSHPLTQATSTIKILEFTPIDDELMVVDVKVNAGTDPAKYNLNILTSVDGLLTLNEGFEVLPILPEVTSITPSSAKPGKTLAVSITGRNTNFSKATSRFSQGTYIGNAFVAASPTSTFMQASGTLTDITSVAWLSNGGEKIYSNNCTATGLSYMQALFEIPSDAYVGPWDLNVLHYGLFPEVLILPNAFEVYPNSDITYDGLVNIEDVSMLAGDWLKGYPQVLYNFTFDTFPGWSAHGMWAFGMPAGLGGTSNGNPDPASGYTGQNVYGVNLNGDYTTTVGGPYYLTSPPFDCSGSRQVHLGFKRWLNTDYPPFVESTVEVSSNGTDWYLVWQSPNDVPVEDAGWKDISYDISPVADNEPTVYVRWGYQVNDNRAFPYSGWNIDDVVITGNR